MIERFLDSPVPAARFQSYTTRCFARIFRFGGAPVDVTGLVEHGHVEGVGAIIAGATNKQVGAISGTWNLTIHPSKDFDFFREVQAGDWVVIWWQRNDRRFHGMLGNIDGLRATSDVVNGATVETVTMSGRDAGKILEMAEVWFNEYVDLGSNVGGKIFGKRMNFIPGGSPDRVVENLLDAFLGAEGNVGGAYRWPAGLRERLGSFFVQGLKMRVLGRTGKNETFDVGDGAILTGKPLLRGDLVNQIALFEPPVGTKLAGMLQQWSNPLLNEMFIDSYVDDDSESPVDAPKPMLHLRERPFVNILAAQKSPWWRLATTRVFRREIKNLDLGTSDQERVNMIMLYARSMIMTAEDQYAAYPPVFDAEDAKNYGLRRWERSIDFAGVGSGDVISWGREIEEWIQLAASWYGLNHQWLNGTATFGWLLAEARVGQRLVIEGDNDADRTQAYIESVAHAFRYPNAPSTTLGLTRGFKGTDTALVAAVVDKAKRFVLPPSSPPKVGG